MNLSIKTKDEILIAKYFQVTNPLSEYLILHGGSSPAKTLYYLAEKLQSSNISSLVFDHSGHGESSGQLKKSSLEKRIQEAQAILKETKLKTPINLCGFSMGGYIAIKLSQFIPVKNLILFCPAAYDKKAYSVPFDQGFTDIIRTQDSWKNSDTYDILSKFTGNLKIIIGDQDEIIPEGIIKLMDEYSQNCQSKEIIKLPKCTHSINSWLQNNPQTLNKIIDKIAKLK